MEDIQLEYANAESPMKMEADCSVMNNKVMYFAAYGVDKVYCYSADTQE